MSILACSHGTLTLNKDSLSFSNGSKTLTLSGEEFVLNLKEGENIVSLPSSKFERKEAIDEQGLLLSFVLDDLKVLIRYSSKDEGFAKVLHVESSKPVFLESILLEGREASLPLSLGGEGMPFFADELCFLGVEFPAADNQREGKTLRCVQHPCVETCSFDSFPVYYGLRKEGETISTSFRRYIQEKSVNRNAPFRYVYGNWGLYDNMTPGDPILTEPLALRSVEDVKRLELLSGVKFGSYVMDAFWFKKGSHYLETDDVLPHGFGPFEKALEEDALDFGLWFDINFREDHPTDFDAEDNLLDAGTYCLGCERPYLAMKKALIDHVKAHHLKALKIDFAYFDCKNPAHPHAMGPVASKEASIKNFLDMVSSIKAIEPNLVFYCYNGFTFNLDSITNAAPNKGIIVSPYWSWFVDYVYCGDPRPNEIPTDDEALSLSGYTDSMVRDFYDSYFPLASIDDHGTMIGNTGTIYYLGKQTFRRGVLLNLMRGGRKIHVYGDLSLLDENDGKYLGFLSSIQKEMEGQSLSMDGDPRKGEIYSYATKGKASGYIALFNPLNHRQSKVVALDGWKDHEIALTKVIEDGELVRQEMKAFGAFVVDLPCGSYRVYRYEIKEKAWAEEEILLKPGQTCVFKNKGYAHMAISFRDEQGNFVRTPNGLPEGIKVSLEEPKLVKSYWSGISWRRYAVKGKEEVTIASSSSVPYRLHVDWEESR